MSKITQTKLSRAIYRDGVYFRYGKKIPVKRITGYNPPESRQTVFSPIKEDKRFVLLSIGQYFNWGKFYQRLKHNLIKGIIFRT